MCGICGKVIPADKPVERELIGRMCRTLVHRGPDDEGIHTAPHVGLGQRRLSIIDLRASATAPLSNEDGSLWVVFNGEIYNFQELRAELIEKGHVFSTNTDTEVILHLYEEHDTACVKKMRGMFAFALWDARRKRLFAARDRFGKKPFCYAHTGTSFVFGSEIKAITADPEISVAPNFNAINAYLTWQYVPSPLTAFAGISKLPAAHWLTYSAADGTLKIQRYWSPPRPEENSAQPAEIEEELLRLLREAVRLRMIADVPLGAFLSGGIDSSAVVALMAQESSRPVKTFSIGFDEQTHNELPFARALAEKYGTEHHEFVVQPSAAEVLPLLVRHYNEPFADSSALPTYYVSKLTREHVTVALSGDGGDENFYGYDRYEHVAQWSALDRVPLLRSAAGGVQHLLGVLPYSNSSAKLERGLMMLRASPPERYRLHMSLFKPQERRASYTENFCALLDERAAASATLDWDASDDLRDWVMRHDKSHYLPDCLMVKTDIAAMANSLEVRCPLLDHHVAEFAATIGTNLKRDQQGGKAILRRAVAKLLPREILEKPKTGFALPLAKWLRTDLAELVRGTLLDDRAAGRKLFQRAFVRRMVDEHLSGSRDWSNRLWALVFLELWFREFID